MPLAQEQSGNRGAIALITVVMVTMLVSIFAVSLAVMNLDYTLTIGSQLIDKSLTVASDGCLDATIGQLASYNGSGSTNVTNIGSANMNCQVTVSSAGNERYLLARTTSTLPFVNTVRNATSTINAAANPITIQRYIEEAEAPTNTLVSGGNINIGTSSGLYASVAVDGGFAYVSYRDGASGNKLTVTKVNLTTFAVVTSLQNVSTVAATFEDSVVYKGYLYVSYRKYTGVNGTSEKLSLAQIDLNNFAAGGVILREDLTTGCVTANCITSPDSVTTYGDVLYLAYRNESSGTDKLNLTKISVDSFASGSFSTLTNISTGKPTDIDMVAYNDNIYIAYEDFGAGRPKLSKINATSFTVTTTLAVDTLGANYVNFVIVDNIGYFVWDEYNNSRNISIARIDIDPSTMVKGTTLRTSTYASHPATDASDGFIYIQANNSSNSVITFIKVDIRKFHTSGVGTVTGYHSGDLYEDPGLVAPGGSYVYIADHNRTHGRARLMRIQVN